MFFSNIYTTNELHVCEHIQIYLDTECPCLVSFVVNLCSQKKKLQNNKVAGAISIIMAYQSDAIKHARFKENRTGT